MFDINLMTNYRLVFERYQEIRTSLDAKTAKYSVLAGVVMTTGTESDRTHQVVALGSGTKCISGKNIDISSKGNVLHDSHAEILARRGLVSFLYSQLEMHLSDPVASIFEDDQTDGDQPYPRLRIKREVEFHLFIQSAPCGDGRKFSHQPNTTPVNPNYCDGQRGQLRTKTERVTGIYDI